ncbi:MAG: 5'-nucleotidase C-terminal domain-containing protein [Spirochaetales bacterium]|nr:5'-nucleotidase C-terminal domain-containing protein [Spirochaetales bacterium]
MFCRFKRVLLVFLVAFFAVTLVFAQSISEVRHGKYDGKTVILHTNDVHGALEGYAKLGALKESFEAEGADVLLVDAGDFAQGTIYVATTKGLNAVNIMNSVGYDIVGIGNHEFDYGFDMLRTNLNQAHFEILCSDVFEENGKTIYDRTTYRTLAGGAVVGFFELDTPETQTKANPALMQGLSFTQGDDLYVLAQKLIDELRAGGADTVICISHLGVNEASTPNRAIDVMENTTGIDYMIDGHSHTVYSSYEGYPMQQTGTKFAYIGVAILDNVTGEVLDYYLADCIEIEPDSVLLAQAQSMMSQIDKEYGLKFAESRVELNGERIPNRTGETNLGDLIADSMKWFISQNPSSINVPLEDLVAIENGGGIRDSIHAGDVSMKDINNVLPFGNTVTVVYVKGSALLEALEASTFACPDQLGGFPQISGMNITIDTTKAYDAGDLYPSSTYHAPASIKRVTINDVNGKPFDPDATYAVVTNDFVAAGGDTYYSFASSNTSFDTGYMLDDVLCQYIKEVCNGVLDESNTKIDGRIKVIK